MGELDFFVHAPELVLKSKEQQCDSDAGHTRDLADGAEVVADGPSALEFAITTADILSRFAIKVAGALGFARVALLPTHHRKPNAIMLDSSAFRHPGLTSNRYNKHMAVAVALQALRIPDLHALPSLAIPGLQTHAATPTARHLALQQPHATNPVRARGQGQPNPSGPSWAACIAPRCPRSLRVAVHSPVPAIAAGDVLRGGVDNTLELAGVAVRARVEGELKDTPCARQVVRVHDTPASP
mmetsp:Transcript_60608/g.195228  ORF Transcript_60608/g.195228 Transcript_60608/m.195228 type:complete len:241 (-) Transcript_60608:597-1319(-)